MLTLLHIHLLSSASMLLESLPCNLPPANLDSLESRASFLKLSLRAKAQILQKAQILKLCIVRSLLSLQHIFVPPLTVTATLPPSVRGRAHPYFVSFPIIA